MGADAEHSAERIRELEELISRLRHDLRGVITPAALVADSLIRNPDPTVQRSGTRIHSTVERIVNVLNATYDLVPRKPG